MSDKPDAPSSPPTKRPLTAPLGSRGLYLPADADEAARLGVAKGARAVCDVVAIVNPETGHVRVRVIPTHDGAVIVKTSGLGDAPGSFLPPHEVP